MKARMPVIAIVFPVLLQVAAGCKTTRSEEGPETLGSVRFSSSATGGTILDSRIKQLEELSKEYPKKSEYPYEMAGVYFQKEDYRESAKALERAIFIDPRESKYHYHLGRVYLQMRELKQAEEAFRRAVELMPADRYTGPHGALGYVLCQEGKWEEALAEYEACARIDPADPTPYYYMGCIHDRLGRSDAAVRNLREYLRRGGTSYRSAAIHLLGGYGLAPPEPEAGPVPDATPKGPGTAMSPDARERSAAMPTDLGDFPAAKGPDAPSARGGQPAPAESR